ncbi:MAG: Ldh family oxidoreductase [Acidobacteriota bacterium]
MKRIAADRLLRLVERAILRRGLSNEHAAWVADGLVETSLRGSDTHGVRLAPTLLAELDGGRSKARPEMVWHGSASTVRTLDAGAALGIVAGRTATAEVVRLAREHGLGAVAVNNSNYFGSAAIYSVEMARRNLAGLAFTNSDALVAPHGGIVPFFGTNPFSFAMRGEAEDDLLCIDMATSQIAFSKIRERRLAGLPLEPGWAVTADGRDAAEAGSAQVVALKPLGGHKGMCLALLVEVVTSVLAGDLLDHELTHLFDPPWDKPRRTSHLFVGFELGAFGPVEQVRGRLSRLLALLRSQTAAASTERIVAPGDLEAEAAEERQKRGIPVTDADLEALHRIDAEAPPEQRELNEQVDR